MPATLAVIVVSTNEAHWLEPCLESVFDHAGGIALDVVVADNNSTDGTRELVETKFPQARVVSCENRGFGHANNRGYVTTTAPFVLFLNPDTKVLDGSFAELTHYLQTHPDVGLVGVKQLTPDDDLHPTIKRFPTVTRMLGEALGSERSRLRANWLGMRELDMRLYEQETSCDWTSGSFMLARREAIEGAGLLDERFFIYSEETDLCLRIRNTGWEIVHVPSMTIVHHAGKGGHSERMSAQEAFAWRQYMSKHFSAPQRLAGTAVLILNYTLRALLTQPKTDESTAKRKAARAALTTLLTRQTGPFGPPPRQAVARHE